jgi:hypothetical protein
MSKFKSVSRKKFEALQKKLQEQEENKSGVAIDYSWQFRPNMVGDKGKTTYRVRILPNVHVNDGMDEPWIQTKAHIFKPKGATKKTYQICPTSKDEEAACPICEASKALFKKEDKVSEDIAKGLWKKKRYHVNALILDDPRAEEQNQQGKVCVWEFGTKVFDKLKEALTTHGMFFWDVNEGYDFLLVIRKEGGYINYDLSDFARRETDLAETEGVDLDKVYDEIHNLEEKVYGVDKDGNVRNTKTYDELLAIFEGRNVKDENTKDESSVEVDKTREPRKTRTRDTEDGSDVTETEDPVSTEDITVEDPVSSEETEPESESEDEGETIDISNIDFDEDDPF